MEKLLMSEHKNSLGQPIGHPMQDWTGSKFPSRSEMLGQYCRLESLDIKLHADDLYQAYGKTKIRVTGRTFLMGHLKTSQISLPG